MSDKALAPFRVTTRTVVMLGPEGIQLVNGAGAPPLLLDYPQLLTLSAIHTNEFYEPAEVAQYMADRHGLDPEVTHKFVRGLVVFRRLRRRPNAVPSLPLPSSTLLTQTLSIANPDLDGLLALKAPLTTRMHQGDFQLIDHDGGVILTLTPADLIALGQFVQPISLEAGFERQRDRLQENAIDLPALRDMLTACKNAGLLSLVQSSAQGKVSSIASLTRNQAKKARFAAFAEEQEAAEASRRESTGVTRPRVIPVVHDESVPAALGLIFAYAKDYADGELEAFYDFRLDWYWDEDRLPLYTEAPAIYLHSNYLWTHEKSIASSARIKALNPDSITIHGGPDTPKYPADAEAYMAQNPHVDIIIRGEGEASCADVLDKLRTVIGNKDPDLSVLRDVPGITYRYKDEIVRTPDRERIGDLDLVPSPYLTGLFDAFIGIPRLHVTLETNRGCPYACTFCDWGSATSSKIRKLDLDRIFAELEWCSRAQIQSVSVADANFGVFERDVFVAEKVSQLKRDTGYPEAFGGSFAKNSTKYLQTIIRLMAEADIWTQGVLSLQTMDDTTLKTIKRSNIKVAKYDALANEMRAANLQLSVELMMALPGSTLDSFTEDLQQCIDRDIQARINHTTLLVNSPMNDPEYMAKYEIKTGQALAPGTTPYIESTSTFTKEDLEKMLIIRDMYILLDNFGVLRLTSRFVRQQTGMREMDFMLRLFEEAGREVNEKLWPTLSTLVHQGRNMMAPPYSWALMIDELKSFLVERLGIADDSALAAIMRAQHALLPAFGRRYPQVVELEHDIVHWHTQMLAAKSAGHWQDWQDVVPPLAEFGPGTMEVNDADGFVTNMLGCSIESSGIGVNWDMDSGIGRARVSQDFDSAWLPEDSNIIQTG